VMFVDVLTIGTGYLVTLLLWLAGVLHLAIIRDRTVYDTRSGTSARWLVVAGLFGLAVRFTFFLWDAGRLVVPLYSLLSIGLFALGMVALALEKFIVLPFVDTKSTRPGELTDHGP